MTAARERALGLAAVALLAATAPVFAGDDETPVFPLNVHQGEGTFTYYSNEEPMGTARSVWSEDGAFQNSAAVTLAGQELKLSLAVKVDREGLWTAISMGSPRGPVEIVRKGGSMEITALGETKTEPIPPGSLILEDMSPALLSQAVAAYDHEKGGKQEFPVYFIPVKVVRGSLEHLSSFERILDGGPRTFRKYRLQLPGVYTIQLLVDEKRRLCLAEYPALHGLFIREGYDALAAGDPETDALLSRPRFEVILERDVGVPMRDGVKLATDIYRPERDGKSPVILVRTPYKKEMGDLQARFYARRGYVFAVQDVRGRFSSPGEWRPFVHEGDDGYDAIEWLAGQEWSSGKVGTIGSSYLGWTQWWAASRHPPHLATMIPNVAPPDPYFNFPYENGAFFLGGALFWADVIEKEATADLSGISMEGAIKIFESEKLKHLPVIDLDELVLGKKVGSWREQIAHPDYDDHWKGLGFLERMKGFDIPVYHQSGWFDGDGIGSKRNYLGMVGHGHGMQKLVLGPWGHTDTDTRSGPHGIDFGPRAVVDLQKSYLRWMDRWLKGIQNGIDKEPRVSLFVMGPNDWLHGDSYPLEGTRMQKLHLAGPTGEAGGRLTWDPPGEGASAPDGYTYDPGDPTPANPRGREDLLVYRTPPLDEPLTIAGPLSAVLYASSSAKDTDWVLRLAKIDKEGNPWGMCRGIIRARYRESFSEPKLLEPGEVCAYSLEMWQTGITVGKGERLTLIVSSALFPIFSRNLNTGGHNETEAEYVKAHQKIYHDRDHPSHVLIPVIPDPEFGEK